MLTSYSAVLFKLLGPPVPIVPPDDIEMFNLAVVPMYGGFDGWVDECSPFPAMKIPLGTRWAYSVHFIEDTDDADFPLKAGPLVAGLLLSLSEAESAAEKAESQGYFVCIFSALIVADREKLN